jgi:sirohydrochlorin cobaltochelatase
MKSSQKFDRALILLAHGSRAPQTLEEMEKLAAKLQHSRKGMLVKPAFLSLIKPDLATALDEVASQDLIQAHILPLFLFTGKHILEDIPELIQASRIRHPKVKLVLHKPIGRHAGFADFLLQAGGMT